MSVYRTIGPMVVVNAEEEEANDIVNSIETTCSMRLLIRSRMQSASMMISFP